MKVAAALAVGVGVYFHKQIAREARFIAENWNELRAPFVNNYNTIDYALLFYHQER